MKGRISTKIALLAAFCASAQGGELAPSWDFLEHEFTNTPPVLSQLSNASPHFRYLLTNRNVDAFIEMTAQARPIGIRLAGFEGLMALEPQKGFECGLRIALSEDPGSFAMAAMYAEIADFPGSTNYSKNLTEAFRTMPVRPNSAYALILALPRSRLRAWFEAQDRDWVVPTYEALVLRRLHSDSRRSGAPPSEKMKRVLTQFAEIPGIPRVEFLARAEESVPAYKRAMELALEDASLSHTDLRGLVWSKASYISNNVNLEGLKLSDERRREVHALLEEFKPAPVRK